MELSQKYKSSSLWCYYSILKSTVKAKHGIDIKSYSKLLVFLKRRSDGHVSKKSKVFSADNVTKFPEEAPDCRYLATKVVLIYGINGACRHQELANITTNDVEDHGRILLVQVKNTKNKIPRSFTIQGSFDGI
ncbi:hypothetical protein evm_002442 [Chilo suppressalis]|nr:hypothetical protein evm_002442 [Chilo suppressalis]